jgi:hypothetical protein
MPQVVEGGVSGQSGRGDRGLPDLPVVVVAPQQSSLRGAAQYVAVTKPESLNMIDHGIEHEPGHGNVAKRRGGLGRCEDRAAVDDDDDDDDLLVNGDHARCRIDTVESQAERLTLTEPRASTDEYQQCIPAWHHPGEREHLAGGKQAHDGGAGLGQANVCAWRLADVAVPDGSAHDAGKYDIPVDGFDGAGGLHKTRPTGRSPNLTLNPATAPVLGRSLNLHVRVLSPRYGCLGRSSVLAGQAACNGIGAVAVLL